MFKGLGNLTSLLQQARDLGGKMQNLTEELRQQRVVGSAGGGLVEIEVNGLMEVLGCRIDPQLVEQRDRELLEDLVATAVGQAIAKGKQLHTESLKSVTGGLEIPGVQQMLGKFFGSEAEETPEAKKPEPPAQPGPSP